MANNTNCAITNALQHVLDFKLLDRFDGLTALCDWDDEAFHVWICSPQEIIEGSLVDFTKGVITDFENLFDVKVNVTLFTKWGVL